MQIDCPHGFKRVMKLGHVTFEDITVSIFDRICDSPDLCGIEHCEHYDNSREATRRFNRALAYSHTLEGMMKERERQEAYREEKRRRHKIVKLRPDGV